VETAGQYYLSGVSVLAPAPKIVKLFVIRFLMQSLSERRIATGVGIEYDSILAEKAREYCLCKPGQEHFGRLKVLHENVLNVDFGEATVLFIYLVPEGIKALR